MHITREETVRTLVRTATWVSVHGCTARRCPKMQLPMAPPVSRQRCGFHHTIVFDSCTTPHNPAFPIMSSTIKYCFCAATVDGSELVDIANLTEVASAVGGFTRASLRHLFAWISFTLAVMEALEPAEREQWRTAQRALNSVRGWVARVHGERGRREFHLEAHNEVANAVNERPSLSCLARARWRHVFLLCGYSIGTSIFAEWANLHASSSYSTRTAPEYTFQSPAGSGWEAPHQGGQQGGGCQLLFGLFYDDSSWPSSALQPPSVPLRTFTLPRHALHERDFGRREWRC